MYLLFIVKIWILAIIDLIIIDTNRIIVSDNKNGSKMMIENQINK